MALRTVELPGNIGLGYKCPNCSMTYSDKDYDSGRTQTIPPNCQRCGCPMDIKPALAFADQQAVANQKNWPHQKNRDMRAPIAPNQEE